jgi:hypothetical protein
LASGLHTSGRVSTCPDLSFGEVWHHLEISFSWAETLAFSSIQQDVPAARGVGRDPGSYCIWSSLYIQPLEAYFVSGAFCSSSYIYLLEPSDVIPDLHPFCIRFLLLIIIKVRSMLLGSISCVLVRSCVCIEFIFRSVLNN